MTKYEAQQTPRQYCGKLGKVENCQSGVFAILSKDNKYSMIDGQLYLPKAWIEDEERRKKAGIPDDIKFKTKIEIAEEMIYTAKTRLKFGWVGFDGGYGKSREFLYRLGDKGLIFMADIPCKMGVYTEKPDILEKEHTRDGKKVKKLVCSTKPTKVSEVIVDNANNIGSMIICVETRFSPNSTHLKSYTQKNLKQCAGIDA